MPPSMQPSLACHLVYITWRTTMLGVPPMHGMQVRCASALVSTLRQRKRELQLVLPWRSMCQLLQNMVADPVPSINGVWTRNCVNCVN